MLFKSLLDFLKRLNNKIINKKIIEALMFSGSLNSIENNQNYLLENLDKLISFNVNFHKTLKNQVNLFQILMIKNSLTQVISNA